MATEILNLSWQIQVALASGYIAYLMAFQGIRASHKAADTTLTTLVFSLIASYVLAITSHYITPLTSAIFSIVCTISVGIAWRVYGRKNLSDLLRAWDISWTTNDPSTLATI
jgi:hypothetical protein